MIRSAIASETFVTAFARFLGQRATPNPKSWVWPEGGLWSTAVQVSLAFLSFFEKLVVFRRVFTPEEGRDLVSLVIFNSHPTVFCAIGRKLAPPFLRSISCCQLPTPHSWAKRAHFWRLSIRIGGKFELTDISVSTDCALSSHLASATGRPNPSTFARRPRQSIVLPRANCTNRNWYQESCQRVPAEASSDNHTASLLRLSAFTRRRYDISHNATCLTAHTCPISKPLRFVNTLLISTSRF